LEAEPKAPRLKVLDDGKSRQISLDHPDLAVAYRLLAEALGSANQDFIVGLLGQLTDLSSQGPRIDESKLNFLLSVIKGIKPNDQLEAMLAAQMALVHVVTMKFGQHFDHVETLPQQDSAERGLSKLTRTYTTQMKALKRYRTGGEQKVTVQHVSVAEGGQAIVGNVTQATREAAVEKPANAKPALTDARQAPMKIIDEPDRTPVAVRRKQKNDGRSSA
jgi:hypothetical protein